ncbi:MAG: hypothetical protein WDW36_006997 [Sanguina aurantia]
MSSITVTVSARSGKTLADITIDKDATVMELKKVFAKLKEDMYPSRQRFSLPPAAGEARGKALEDSSKLSEYGLKTGSVLQFKDLGAQIGYSTVFFWEYFGPMCVYPLFFFFPHIFYPFHTRPVQHALVQKLATAYWCSHYAKRIYETYFVHRFGHATMPVANLVRNCAYYWGFAAFVSYFVNHPLYTAPAPMQSYVALGAALLCQAANYRCHTILANLRAPGDKGYSIPRGFLFNYITCANYTAEICGWLLFTVAVQALPAAVFSVVGAAQMLQWAVQKHKRLLKAFDGKEGRAKYPRRWIVLPPFL